MVRDSWPNNQLHEEYLFWDSLIMRNVERSDEGHGGENEFAEWNM